MKRSLVIAVNVTLCMLLMATLIFADEKTYVCPPCGEPCHDGTETKTFSKPGSCPICRMPLIDRDDIIDVAILVFDGVQIIDYTAPWEIFGQADFQVFTVSEKTEPLSSNMNLKMTPHFTFDNHPDADILLLPGGRISEYNEKPEVISWIQKTADNADYVLSVCNGAFFLAKAGLLENKSATTFYRLLQQFEDVSPNTKIVDDKRFVDNGKIITSAGLSAGMDASLHLISKIRGLGTAQQIALNLEYRWQPDVEFARSILADYRYLRGLNLMQGFESELINTSGGTENWKMSWKVTSDKGAEDVFEQINSRLKADADWIFKSREKTADTLVSYWQMNGEMDEKWDGELSVEPSEDQNKITIEIRINKMATL